MSTDSAGVVLGRPRDPEVGRRVAAAAVEVYGELGWSGFSIEAAARRAGVGKASVYLRWSNREELLVDALRTQLADVAEIDTGSIREDLAQLARHMLELYLGPAGPAAMRLGLDIERFPALQERHHALGDSQRLAARAIVQSAIDRGDLPAGTSVTLLLDTLCGGAMFHAMSSPPSSRNKLRAELSRYSNRLADFVLTAVAVSR